MGGRHSVVRLCGWEQNVRRTEHGLCVCVCTMLHKRCYNAIVIMPPLEVVTVMRSSMSVCDKFGFPLWKQMALLWQTWQTVALPCKTWAVAHSNVSGSLMWFRVILQFGLWNISRVIGRYISLPVFHCECTKFCLAALVKVTSPCRRFDHWLPVLALPAQSNLAWQWFFTFCQLPCLAKLYTF